MKKIVISLFLFSCLIIFPKPSYANYTDHFSAESEAENNAAVMVNVEEWYPEDKWYKYADGLSMWRIASESYDIGWNENDSHMYVYCPIPGSIQDEYIVTGAELYLYKKEVEHNKRHHLEDPDDPFGDYYYESHDHVLIDIHRNTEDWENPVTIEGRPSTDDMGIDYEVPVGPNRWEVIDVGKYGRKVFDGTWNNYGISGKHPWIEHDVSVEFYAIGDSKPPYMKYYYLKNPLNLSKTNKTKDSVSLDWSGNGNPDDTRYRITANGDTVWEGTGTSCAVNNLEPDTEYNFTVRTIYEADGKTYTSSGSHLTTKTEPEITVVPPENFNVSTGQVNADLTWDNASENPDGVEYRIIVDGNIKDTTDKTSYTVDNLAPDKKYNFTIETKYEHGGRYFFSDRISDSADTKQLNKPESLTHDAGANKIELDWSSAPAPSGTEYQVVKDGSKIWQGPDTNYTAKNLNPGTSYDFEVYAVYQHDGDDYKSDPATGTFKTINRPDPPDIEDKEECYYTPAPTFDWDYSHPSNLDQTAFELEIVEEASGEKVFNTNQETSSTEYKLSRHKDTTSPSNLWESSTNEFELRVKTKDTEDNWSEWNSENFCIIAFERPRINEIAVPPSGQTSPEPGSPSTHIDIWNSTTDNLPTARAGSKVGLLFDTIGPVSNIQASFPLSTGDSAIKMNGPQKITENGDNQRWHVEFRTSADLKQVPDGTVVNMELESSTKADLNSKAIKTKGSVYETWHPTLKGRK